MTDYFLRPEMSQSKLKKYAECKRAFFLEYITDDSTEIEQENTPALQFGKCWDYALTEPDKYQSLVVKDTKTTKVDGCITKVWKDKIDAGILRLNAYKMELPEFSSAGNALTLAQIFNKCIKQEEIYWTDSKTDIACKGKLDFSFSSNGYCFIIDLKSTRRTILEDFIDDIIKLKYYLQAAMYCNGKRIIDNLSYYPPFYFIGISTITGEIFAVKVSEQMLTLGLIEMEGLLEEYKNSLITDDWNTDRCPIVADLPEWQEKQIMKKYVKGYDNDN